MLPSTTLSIAKINCICDSSVISLGLTTMNSNWLINQYITPRGSPLSCRFFLEKQNYICFLYDLSMLRNTIVPLPKSSCIMVPRLPGFKTSHLNISLNNRTFSASLYTLKPQIMGFKNTENYFNYMICSCALFQQNFYEIQKHHNFKRSVFK